MQNHPILLSLKQVASWHGPSLSLETPVRASVPALQRGLVWKPHQIELLWESLLRGFPIGAFVICPKIESQQRSSAADAHNTHHLLDGQQRSTGIALGFTDPFAEANAPASVLWIDLAPEIPAHSTRQFLLRLTTTAHPWGYHRNDPCSILSAGRIREALHRAQFIPEVPGKPRPHAHEIGPAEARAPVPLAWLLEAFSDGTPSPWQTLAARIEAHGPAPWKASALDALATPNREQLRPLEEAVRQLAHYQIVLLQASGNLLKTTPQEASRSGAEDVTHIEHLFERLNQQGTKLDGEELAYSMMKAYWPEVADSIDHLHPRRMPASRLAATVLRAAQALQPSRPAEATTFPGVPSVSQIRALAADRPSAAVEALTKFFHDGMSAANARIERWLGYHPVTRPKGLLPVHLQQIAKDSRDLYALLFHLAAKCSDAATENATAPAVLRLTAHVHLFATDKAKAVRTLHAACAAGFSAEALEAGLEKAIHEEGTLLKLRSPATFEALVLPDESEDLRTWTWWGLVSGTGEPEHDTLLQNTWWPLFQRILHNRELLLYAQRPYLFERFPDYDTSRRDYWEDPNRPWDFDHILAQKFVRNIKRKKAAKEWLPVCGQVAHTIGNLRAWPFEENRSDSAERAADKIHGRAVGDSFLLESELPAYSGGGDILTNTHGSAEVFVHTTLRRLCRIYREAYEGLGLEA
jgi:hypothetical protein